MAPLPPRAALWLRRLARLLTAATLVAFAGFVVVELRNGFDRRRTDLAAAGDVAEDAEEVLSRGIEVTAWDAQGRRIEIEAEEALGPSRGKQRFLGVSVLFPGAYGDAETRIAADELLVNTAEESLEFLGNALLVSEGLEIASDSLRFRPGPDRFWSSETTQFVTDDYRGIATAFRFEIEFSTVILREVVADPVVPGGPGLVAAQLVIDGTTGDIRLGGEPEIRAAGLLLTSREPIVLRRDQELGQTRSVEAGFGTVLSVFETDEGDEGAEGEDPAPGDPASAPEPAFVVRGDEVVIDLDGVRRPRAVRIRSGAWFSDDPTDLRANLGELELDPEGRPTRLLLREEVDGRLSVGRDRQRVVRVSTDRMEVGFRDDGALGEVGLRGAVEAGYGRAVARSGEATFDGASTMVLRDRPRVEDLSLLEIDGATIRFHLAGEGRVEVLGDVSARFRPDRLDWLPGGAAAAGLTSDRAVLETGSGRGTFHGDVRLLFGENVLSAGMLAVDAGAPSLHAWDDVRTAFAFRRPPAEAEEDGAGDAAAPGTPPPPGEDSVRFDGRASLFAYDGAEARLTYEGSPEIDQHAEAETTRVRGARLVGQLGADGALEAVVSERGARFERGGERVRGARIRYRPGPDRLVAWGAPARAEFGGERTEAARLELDFRADRSELDGLNAGRVFARVDLSGDRGGAPAEGAAPEDAAAEDEAGEPARRRPQ